MGKLLRVRAEPEPGGERHRVLHPPVLPGQLPGGHGGRPGAVAGGGGGAAHHQRVWPVTVDGELE